MNSSEFVSDAGPYIQIFMLVASVGQANDSCIAVPGKVSPVANSSCLISVSFAQRLGLVKDYTGPAWDPVPRPARAKTMRDDRFKRLVDAVCDHGGGLGPREPWPALQSSVPARSCDGMC